MKYVKTFEEAKIQRRLRKNLYKDGIYEALDKEIKKDDERRYDNNCRFFDDVFSKKNYY